MQAFNGKKWEKFHSDKVASISYARIQGRDSLVAHFKNSSVMNEDKGRRPILFRTHEPNVGDMVNQFLLVEHIRVTLFFTVLLVLVCNIYRLYNLCWGIG